MSERRTRARRSAKAVEEVRIGEGIDVEQRIETSIDALGTNEQTFLIMKLTEYADYLIRTDAYWMSRGILPRGYDAPSLALEAISRVLDGRRRDWDPDKEPTLLAYLKSVVKSIFSSEILPAAQRELAELPATDDADTDRIANAPSQDAGPHAKMEVDELKELILASFDQPEDQLVLMCIFEDTTEPAAISEQTGIEPYDVYRIKQKIKRRLATLRKDA